MNPLKLFDTHAHLTSSKVFDVENMLSRAKEQGVERIVNICTDHDSLERGLELSRRYDWIFNTAATTPHDVETEGVDFFPEVVRAAKNKQLIALGETGLDYFYEHSNRAIQKQSLIDYFCLAIETQLPLIFHCRDAFTDLFELADQEYRNAPALLHCFTGNFEEAKQVIDRGWFLSLSGILTFKKSNQLQEIARQLPLSQIVIETDTPYLAPQSKRGQTNEPSFIVETVKYLADLRHMDPIEVAQTTTSNACKFFKINY